MDDRVSLLVDEFLVLSRRDQVRLLKELERVWGESEDREFWYGLLRVLGESWYPGDSRSEFLVLARYFKWRAELYWKRNIFYLARLIKTLVFSHRDLLKRILGEVDTFRVGGESDEEGGC